MVLLWERLHTPGFGRSSQLQLAARRFAYKGERARVDDQLVDLIVSAEALFLSDTDDDSRCELSYRRSSRAAWYIADSQRSRRSIFDLFRAAYRMRSRLVQGTAAKAMNVAGEQVAPSKIVDVIEDLLRHALLQAIGEAATGTDAWRVDWKGLLFPESSAEG